MLNRNPTKEWDKIWSKDNSLRFGMLSPTYNYILKHTESNYNVLELGAGIGFLANRLKAQKQCDILAVDHSQVAIDALKENGHRTKKLDLCKKGAPDYFKGKTFDMVLGTEFLEHLPNDKRDHLLNVVSKCGPAIFSVPDDRLGPKVESQHYIQWNKKTFRTYLKKFYSKVKVVSVGDNITSPRYLVATCGNLNKRKRETLSISYTLKNEGETIYKAIESVKEVADEIIIGIDDKTADNTKEECLRAIKDFKISKYEIFDFKWDNSFCKARNASLEKCTSDWIYVIDGHEFLREESQIYLKNLHNIPQEISNLATKLQIFENLEDVAPISFFYFQKLIRNFSGIKYIYDVHNRLDIPFGTNGFSDKIIADHRRGEELEEQRRTQRIKMNAAGLKKQYKDTKDPRHLFYLGNTQMTHGFYKSAITAYKKYLIHGKTVSERLVTKISMSKCYDALGEHEKAYKMLLSTFGEDNYKAEVYLMLGHRAMLMGKYDEGRRWLKMATTLPFPIVPADIFHYGAYTYLPWVKLAECEMRAGYLDKARQSLVKVLDYEQIPEEIRTLVSSYEETINKTLEENNNERN